MIALVGILFRLVRILKRTLASMVPPNSAMQPMSLITACLIARAYSLTADGWVVGRLLQVKLMNGLWNVGESVYLQAR